MSTNELISNFMCRLRFEIFLTLFSLLFFSGSLYGYGKKLPEVNLEGKISVLFSAHASSPPKGKNIEQEFDAEDGSHTVIYVEKKISCPGKVKLTGTWFTFEVKPEKQQGQIVTKTTEPYTERQFAVSRWECL